MAALINLPPASVLKHQDMRFDYIDSYQGVFNDLENNLTPTTLARMFFSGGPAWIGFLFKLRNSIVGVLGLKTSATAKHRQQLPAHCAFEPGDRMGLFRVMQKTGNEIVLGEDDKHLNFRVSLLIDDLTANSHKKNLTITTVVQFNNWLGRIYFLPVRPLHQLIVPAMLKSIIAQIEKDAGEKQQQTI